MHPEYLEYVETIPGVIGHWDLGERAGLVAYDRSKKNPDAAHVGVTLGGPGIGDGRPAPFYDGVGDYTNVWTASFQGRFSGSEGTAAICGKVNGVGVWADGVARYFVTLFSDASNWVHIRKMVAANQIYYYYEAGGVAESLVLPVVASVDWIHLAMTWSASTGPTGEVRMYLNGAQVGATQVALGAWGGVGLDPTQTVIAARTTGPSGVWHGWLQHGFVLNRAAGPEEVREWHLKGRQGGMA